jgi:predicted adenylyl cyclase CyaB
MPSNIEIKARLRGDLQHVRERAARLASEPAAVIRQQDTFFWTPQGRLKLRVPSPGRAELIYYERANEPRPRRSVYSVVAVSDAPALKRVLEESLGVRGVVRKTRELFIAGDTRIHIDDVESLGRFVELEVALTGADEEAARARCRELMRALDVEDADLVDGAYVDLLEGCLG